MIRPQDLKITWGRYEVYCKRVEDGRFIWEKNLTLFLGDRWEKSEDFLMFVKVFHGYKYYKPWVEMFSINPAPLGIKFFGSLLEKNLIESVYEKLPVGGKIYVEYYEDRDTFNVLKRGGDPYESRLGKVLAGVGFKNLRNWYYPEGLREGGMKIGGEK